MVTSGDSTVATRGQIVRQRGRDSTDPLPVTCDDSPHHRKVPPDPHTYPHCCVVLVTWKLLDPSYINIFHRVYFNPTCCSPYRTPFNICMCKWRLKEHELCTTLELGMKHLLSSTFFYPIDFIRNFLTILRVALSTPSLVTSVSLVLFVSVPILTT